MQLLYSGVVLDLLGSYLVFTVCRWIYRLSPLHPLSKFPAPSKLACISDWYQFYWNVVRDGTYTFRIERWHEEYGPIIRIGPNELHINDPDFYHVCYSLGYRFDADREFYRGIAGPLDTLVGKPPHAHKPRRTVLSTLFSKANVRKLDDNLCRHVSTLANKISEEGKTSGTGIYLTRLFTCLSIDIISEYAYSQSLNTLDGSSDSPIAQAIENAKPVIWFSVWFWPLMQPVMMLPFWLMKMIVPAGFTGLLDLQKLCGDKVDEFIDDPDIARAKTTHTTIFETILEGSTGTSAYRPTRDMLIGDAAVLMAAGAGTTSDALTMIVYEACLNPRLQQTLHDELVKAFPGGEETITPAECEKLSYLTAFIKESFRISTPAPGRLPRIVPEDGTTFNGIALPPGTKIGVSARITLHNNPDIFPNPHIFDPERWMTSSPSNPEERHFAPFSKGSRSCPGINLAWAKLHLTTAYIFRRFKFSLHPNNTLTRNFADKYVREARGELVVSIEDYDNVPR